MTGASLVVGLGRADSGDDGAGPAVARLVAARLAATPGVSVLEEQDPTELLDLWDGHEHVVVVDAVVTGAPVGAVHRLELGASAPPLSAAALLPAARGGSHAFGLAAAVELARALHRLPARLVVVGIEAGDVGTGAAMSPEVSASVEAAADLVGEEVAADVSGRTG